MKGVEVVICSHNGATRLPVVLEALASQGLCSSDWGVLIVDNASTDETSEIARCLWRRSDVTLRIIPEPEPGQTKARERARLEATREFICFCDDDNVLAPDYLEVALARMQLVPRAGALGGRGEPVSSAPLPPWFASAAEGYAVGPQGETEGEVAASRGFVYGAGMVVRRRAWDQLASSGFRSRLTGRSGRKLNSGDDNELCLGLSLMGWKIHYTPKLVFQHLIAPHRLNESYCRALYRSFGEATATLAAYRDFQRQRAKPSSWKICALNRALQGLCFSLASVIRPPSHAALDLRELRREFDLGRALACRHAMRSGRFFSLYQEIADWLGDNGKKAET